MPSFYPASVLPPQLTNPDTGELASGFVLNAFLAGTSTPTPIYIDKDGTSSGSSITLNAAGYPEVSGAIVTIWLQTDIDYKFILEDGASNNQWTLDDISGIPRDAQNVATYTQLRAIDTSTFVDGSPVSVTSPGINGQGILRNVASHGLSDNGGTIIVIDSNWYWERTTEGYIYLPWFEIPTDGSDVTTQLQPVISLGGEIRGKDGDIYYTTDAIDVSSGTSLIGKWGITTGGNRLHYGFELYEVSNIIFDGTIIKGVSGEDGFDIAIFIREGCENIEIRNTFIDNIGSTPGTSPERGNGIYIASPATSNMNKFIRIENNKITNIKGAGGVRGDFVYAAYMDELWVLNNDFNQSERMGVALTDFVTNWRINGNSIINPGLAGVDMEPNSAGYHCAKGEIRGNTITNYGAQAALSIGIQKFAVDFHGQVEDVVFENNICTAGANGIEHVHAQNGARNFRVRNNTFIGAVSGDAVKLFAGSGSSDYSFVGNKFGTSATPLTGKCFNLSACTKGEIHGNVAYSDGTDSFVFASESGGLSVSGNKVVNGFTKLLEYRASSAVNNLVVRDNITVDLTTYGIHFRPSGGSARINGVVIEGNEFDGATATNVVFFEYLSGGQVAEFKYGGNKISGTWTANSNNIVNGSSHYRYVPTSASIGSPFNGQVVYSFADNRVIQYDGSVWV